MLQMLLQDMTVADALKQDLVSLHPDVSAKFSRDLRTVLALSVETAFGFALVGLTFKGMNLFYEQEPSDEQSAYSQAGVQRVRDELAAGRNETPEGFFFIRRHG
jgi:hypothetical protein